MWFWVDVDGFTVFQWFWLAMAGLAGPEWLWLVLADFGWLWLVLGGCDWLSQGWMIVGDFSWFWLVAFFYNIQEINSSERNNLLNKRSELIKKCRHLKKHTPSNYVWYEYGEKSYVKSRAYLTASFVLLLRISFIVTLCITFWLWGQQLYIV